jgi:hypothetical protein
MPLFNNAAIAALFKATGTSATPNTTNGNDSKKNQNRGETKKCKLVKQEVPTGVTVLHLVLPTTEDSYYTDMPSATTAQALEAIMEILEQQEEDLKLVGKQEWMEEWLSNDNPQVPLSGIEKIESKMFDNYFQQGVETVGSNTKEIWHFAILGTTDKGNMIKLAKATINDAQWRTQLNLNYFPEINNYYAGWLSGADLEVFQLSDVGGAIMKSLMKVSPNNIQLEEDESGSDLTPLFDIQTVRYSSTTNSQTKMSSPVYMVTCAQKNLARVCHLLSMLNRDYHNNRFNEFVSTKATPKQRWDKLEDNINFYSSKNTSSWPARVSALSTSPRCCLRASHIKEKHPIYKTCSQQTRSSPSSNTHGKVVAKSSVNAMIQQSAL